MKTGHLDASRSNIITREYGLWRYLASIMEGNIGFRVALVMVA